MKLVIALLFTSLLCQAQSFLTLHQFGHARDGAMPYSGVIVDSSGNVYGTTLHGGGYGYGDIYKLNGQAETILHRFGDEGGRNPMSPLVADANGNFYGTTLLGDRYTKRKCSEGCGTVFKITGGVITILYRFQNGKDGKHPMQGLTLDSAGNLYGSSDKAIFEIQNGKFIILASQPVVSNLVLDGQGNLYGVSSANELFEVSIATGAVTILYTFQGMAVGDGSAPMGTLISDAKGNIYGTTEFGGVAGCPQNGFDNGCGTLWEWSQGAETVLYRFQPDQEAHNPQFGVIQDAAGNFYGVTTWAEQGYWGAVYEVSNQGVESVLYNFTGTDDGGNPQGALALASDGYLYGTTSAYGKYGYGTAFRLLPGK